MIETMCLTGEFAVGSDDQDVDKTEAVLAVIAQLGDAMPLRYTVHARKAGPQESGIWLVKVDEVAEPSA